MNSGSWQREVDLPSERGASRLITEDLLEHLGVHGWPPSDIFSIHLAAEEAIVNAIIHGNKLDPAKKVHVSCMVSPELARVEVTDEGPGFDPASVPDCRLDERQRFGRRLGDRHGCREPRQEREQRPRRIADREQARGHRGWGARVAAAEAGEE